MGRVKTIDHREIDFASRRDRDSTRHAARRSRGTLPRGHLQLESAKDGPGYHGQFRSREGGADASPVPAAERGKLER
jgi:hypothetical protein